MKVRAKLQVESVTVFPLQDVVKFTAVGVSGVYPADGSDEDNTFAKWTPTANLSMTVANPELLGKFRPGQQYYVDFSPAVKAAEDAQAVS